ncbi:MAG: methyltransferase domain-containing protein [Candidatus Aminicenantes bacterium]|nr:methyltransferase domain-containing protein [Candidatus Aminicenantes bacterium]
MISMVFLSVFCLSLCQQKTTSDEGIGLDVPYVPTPMKVVDEMLELADLEQGDVLLDLGCGDGRIVIQAAVQYTVRGSGVDLNSERVEESRQNARIAGVENLVEFHNQNLYETDLSEATVITLYLLPSVNLKLRPRIFDEVKPGTRVLSHDFDMNSWTPDEESMVILDEEAHFVYYWMVPANVSGDWKVVLADDSLETIIRFTQVFQYAQGSVIPETETWKVTEEQLSGSEIGFKIKSPDKVWTFTGRVNEDVMSGDVQSTASQKKTSWKALRNPDTKQPIDKSSH